MEEIVKKVEPPVPLQSDDIDKNKPINKNDFGVVFNFLAKIACQVCYWILSVSNKYNLLNLIIVKNFTCIGK